MQEVPSLPLLHRLVSVAVHTPVVLDIRRHIRIDREEEREDNIHLDLVGVLEVVGKRLVDMKVRRRSSLCSPLFTDTGQREESFGGMDATLKEVKGTRQMQPRKYLY
jgi:hypothetical protein